MRTRWSNAQKSTFYSGVQWNKTVPDKRRKIRSPSASGWQAFSVSGESILWALQAVLSVCVASTQLCGETSRRSDVEWMGMAVFHRSFMDGIWSWNFFNFVIWNTVLLILPPIIWKYKPILSSGLHRNRWWVRSGLWALVCQPLPDFTTQGHLIGKYPPPRNVQLETLFFFPQPRTVLLNRNLVPSQITLNTQLKTLQWVSGPRFMDPGGPNNKQESSSLPPRQGIHWLTKLSTYVNAFS